MISHTDIRRLTTVSALMAALFAPLSAPALEPEEADLVTSSTLQVPQNFDIEEGVAYVGIEECETMLQNEATITATWALTFDPATSGEAIEEFNTFSVARDSTARIDCSTGELCLRVPDEDIDFGASSVSAEIPFLDIMDQSELTECAGFDREFFFRITVEESIGGESTDDADAKMVMDTMRPTAPSGLTATATENSITVSFEASPESDVARYFVFYSETAFEGGQIPDGLEISSKVLGENTSGDISVDLEGDTLFVAVAAEDETGNLSPLSGVSQANVVATNDFWEEYRAAGGSETGGCTTTNGPGSLGLIVLVLGGLFVGRRRRRRKRWLAAATLGGALMLAPMTASADTDTWGAFELKLGGYYPAIDEEFGGSGPFGDTFGNKNLVIGELEVDGWLWQGFGKLGLGGHIGFSRVKGNARAADPAEQTEVSDTTTFSVMPLRASLVYRFDWLAQHTAIPLSAGVKVGPDFYRWRIADSNGDTATVDGDAASGWKTGWHFAAGLQLLLDVIDPATAAAFDLNWGVNNSYLFAELMVTRVDGFGAEGFDLSDNIWMFGLSFEF